MGQEYAEHPRGAECRMETTDLTVVTLTRGLPQVLSMCLSHLELQTYPAPSSRSLWLLFLRDGYGRHA